MKILIGIVAIFLLLLIFLIFQAASLQDASLVTPVTTSTPLVPLVATWTSTPPSLAHKLTHTPTPKTIRITPSIAQRNTPTPSRPIVVTNRTINIRSGPGTNYSIIDTVSSGRKFFVTGKNPPGTWWEIVYNSHGGWVYGELVTATDTQNVKIIAVAPPTRINPTNTPPRPTATKLKPKPKPTNTTHPKYVPISPSYENLYRNIDQYFRQHVIYTGVVIQAVQIQSDNKTFGDYQLVVIVESSVRHTDVFLMLYELADYRLLPGDTIQFLAEVRELTTYQTISYGPLTVPYLKVLDLKLVE